MTAVLLISGIMLVIAAFVTLTRMVIGPGTLDRLIALDTLVGVTIAGLIVWVAYSYDSTLVPAIVALSLVGFIGSVSVSRFRVRDAGGEHS